MNHITALERQALLAALQAPMQTLRRFGGVFAAPPAAANSGTTAVQVVTKRMALRLHRDNLMELDDTIAPSSLTLTAQGRALAETLRANAGGKR